MQPSPYFSGPIMDVSGFQDAYVWFMVFGVISAFLMAYGIGANDVANAFATSVGAKSLTFKQAVMLATVCETLGAAFLGAEVAKTVRKGIVDLDYFKWNPEMLMVGMCCALFAAGIWLIMCSSWGLPVSTTHSIVGAIMGIGLAVNPDTIKWETVGLVVLSWFASPLLSGIFSAMFFLTFRKFILRMKDGHQRALASYPILVLLLVLSIVVCFTFKIPYKSLKDAVKKDEAAAMGIAVAISIGISMVVFLGTYKWIKGKVDRVPETDSTCGNIDFPSTQSREMLTDAESIECAVKTELQSSESSVRGKGSNESFQPHESELDEGLQQLHDAAEKFPPKTEEVYNYLLVVAACFCSIAHGANDVANSIGPFAAVYAIYTEAQVGNKVGMPWWISVGGGLVISFGLLTYGYKVLATMSVKLCTITPSRGFAIELGGTWVIIMGSYLGIPLSTTHCKVGATIGVGLCESPEPWKFKGVNVHLLGKVMVGWVTTLLFTAGLSICLFTVVSVVFFPRMEGYPCSNIHGNANFDNKGLISQYYSDRVALQGNLTQAFTRWDASQDGALDVAEIAAKIGGDNEGAEKFLKSWTEDGDSMTLKEWLEWRCANEKLDTVETPCNPLCSNEMLTSGAYCELSVRDGASDLGYALTADYQVSTCA